MKTTKKSVDTQIEKSVQIEFKSIYTDTVVNTVISQQGSPEFKSTGELGVCLYLCGLSLWTLASSFCPKNIHVR